MKLTMWQALRRIADLRGRLKERLARAERSLVFTDAEKPAFVFQDVVQEAEAIRAELLRVEVALRIGNAEAMFEYEGKPMTLAEATVRLAEHKGRIAWLKGLKVRAQAESLVAKQEYDEEGKPVKVEKRYFCALPEAERERQVEAEQAAFNALNDAVEAVNHRQMIEV